MLFRDSIFHLAHYFDCQRLLQRCEEVALLLLSGCSACSAWQVTSAWLDLRFADQYKLQAWKQRCCQIIAADKYILTRPHYTAAKEERDSLLMDVMDALAARAAKAPTA